MTLPVKAVLSLHRYEHGNTARKHRFECNCTADEIERVHKHFDVNLASRFLSLPLAVPTFVLT